jgi:excisionase family DNA binding protein
MPKKTLQKGADESALFVRLPAAAAEKLDRAAESLGMKKKDLVASLVSKYVAPGQTQGSYSFHPYDPPEVMNAAQAADFLQIEEALVVELAAAGKLPGRKLGAEWRFSRVALVAWLAGPEKR